MKQPHNKTVIIITGPTAAGKTSAAIKVAQHFQTSILSADSRQCFKEMNIGVARPSIEELKQVKHYFIASHSIQEEITAAFYEQYALQKIGEIFLENKIAVMVGGTGLYIKAFCEGLDHIPAIDPVIREQIIASYQKKGIAWLQEEIKMKDPVFFATGEIENPQRMMRALEVWEGTGHSILHFRKGNKALRDFTIIKIGLTLPKDALYAAINQRVDQMIVDGLVEEARSLLPFKELNALQTVGYAELFRYFNGDDTLAQAIDKIKINTRHYAKRQLTWFKKDPSIHWITAGETNKLISILEERLT